VVVSSFDPFFGSQGVWTMPLQLRGSGGLGTAAYTRLCSQPAALFSSMGSVADPFPYYSVDLGGEVEASDVQIFFDASAQAWPVNGVAVFLQAQQWEGNTSGVGPDACFSDAGAAPIPFGASVQGPCNATGRYLTVQLAGESSAAQTSRGASRDVLRICALLLYGVSLTQAPPPPATQAAPASDQTRSVALSVVLPIFGCCLLYAALSAWLRARRAREAARLAAERARAAKAPPVPTWPTHHVLWSLRNTEEWETAMGAERARSPPPTRAAQMVDVARLMDLHTATFG